MALKPTEDHPSADYIFWLDSDNMVPPDTILKLLHQNKQVISCLYWTKKGEPHPVAYYFEGDEQKPLTTIRGTTFKVDGVGMGSCLMRSTVLATLCQKVPIKVPIFHDRPFVVRKDGKLKYNWFATHEDEKGDLTGEDIYFCRLLKEYTKVQVWVDPTIETWHSGTADVHHTGREAEVDLV
jgi:hypothetical protein